MILWGGVPATAARADFRLDRRDEGAMGQSRVVVGKVLGGSASWQFSFPFCTRPKAAVNAPQFGRFGWRHNFESTHDLTVRLAVVRRKLILSIRRVLQR
jgi:hypothetical protein